ncbi:MAG: hypothetical protein AAFQ82_13475, partial [Myxococcota bacterium]
MSERSANLFGVTLLLVTLAWNPWIDRLELPKLWVALTCTVLIVGWALGRSRQGGGGIAALLVFAALLGTCVPWARAGFEAWAVPWCAACLWWALGPMPPERWAKWVSVAVVLQSSLALLALLGDPLGLSSAVPTALRPRNDTAD